MAREKSGFRPNGPEFPVLGHKEFEKRFQNYGTNKNCLFVSMYVCEYVCVYVCLNVRMYVCIYVCIYV